MRATYLVEFQTGYELSDNDRVRLQERIAENLRHLAEEYLAEMDVNMSHFVSGPTNVQRSENQS
jgi:hypothetical protein